MSDFFAVGITIFSGNIEPKVDVEMDDKASKLRDKLPMPLLMESFFHLMKCEPIRGNVFNSDKELRGALGSYINNGYSFLRIHSGIRFCSTTEYEALVA